MADQNKTLKKLARNIRNNPDDSFSKFALALEFLKQDNIRRARLLFEDIYQNDPGYVGVYYHLGKLYERTGHSEEALQKYEEGIEVAAEKNEARTRKELQEARAQLNMQMEE